MAETHAWWWKLQDRSGAEVDVTADLAGQRFPTEKEAEAWIGEVFADLLDEGVDQVTLFELGRAAYGPMSLHPDAS